MNEQSLRRTLQAVEFLVKAAIVFFIVSWLNRLSYGFGEAAESADHSRFLYVSVVALFIVAFITRRIGRWHGFISTLLFTGFVAWICWVLAADFARGYETGWQHQVAQQWLSILRWSVIWGLVFAVGFCIFPSRQTNSDATGIALLLSLDTLSAGMMNLEMGGTFSHRKYR